MFTLADFSYNKVWMLVIELNIKKVQIIMVAGKVSGAYNKGTLSSVPTYLDNRYALTWEKSNSTKGFLELLVQSYLKLLIGITYNTL